MKDVKKQNNIKHREQVDFYNDYEGEKCLYSTFYTRIKKQGLSLEEAIKPGLQKKGPEPKTKSDQNGRVCAKCGEYKLWDCFYNYKLGHNGKTSKCKYCRNQEKAEYRERTNRQKDIEYRKKTRKLYIGEIICLEKPRIIDGIPREDRYEVIKYEYKKGYMLRSTIDGIYTWIDTGDNPNKKRFYRLNDENESNKTFE